MNTSTYSLLTNIFLPRQRSIKWAFLATVCVVVLILLVSTEILKSPSVDVRKSGSDTQGTKAVKNAADSSVGVEKSDYKTQRTKAAKNAADGSQGVEKSDYKTEGTKAVKNAADDSAGVEKSDKKAVENMTDYGSCPPHKPSQEAIKMVKRIYKLDPKLTRCGMGKGTPAPAICHINVQLGKPNKEMKHSFNVVCNRICKERSKKDMLLVLTVKSGYIKDAGSFQTIAELEKGVMKVVHENIKKNIHFVVIRCTSNELNSTAIRTQILPIDPRLTIRRKNTPRDKNLVNVNILLSDSVSRAHFHRSLPKTVGLFKKWTSKRSLAPARVFDFELFQAVEGHTTENTHALFNGRLMPLDKTESEREVHPGAMFGAFQKAGFQTMWQEDLCWKAVWGLKLDLKAGSWDNLQQKLKENFIDHVGLTDSSCEVLEYVYKTKWPFYDPIQICYAGQFQHRYFFNYTLDTLRAISSDAQALPLFTYMASNVGHDHTGRRIQSHDLTLLEYVKKLSLLDDTITILLADHGNTYTRYTVDIIEGRFEMYHPHLFLIIPNKVAERLGKDALDALEVNQRRLLTVVDLHQSIMALRYPLTGRVLPKGLFTPIMANRTCNEVELRRPNFCVCDGWDMPVKNDDKKIALVEFAVGMLNVKLDLEIMKNSNRTLYPRSCIRLRAVGYSDVRERRDSKLLYTSMQITVASAKKGKETFHIEVESLDKSSQSSLDIKLKQFDRLSMYGPYGACADKGAPLKLCTCVKASKEKQSKNGHLKVSEIIAPSGPKYLGTQDIIQLNNDSAGCLHLISRGHNNVSYAYELANVCHDKAYRVEVDVRSKGMELSRPYPFRITVVVGTRFLLSARVEDGQSADKHHIDIDVKVLKTKQHKLFTK